MRVVVGRIGRAHGIRGDVAVEVRTDEPERRLCAGASVLDGDRTWTIAAARHHAGRLLVHLEGVDDRDAAEALRGRVLEADIDPAERPDDPEDFYDHQLVGLAARDAAGRLVGRVEEVLHLPGQDVLGLRLQSGRDVLVPFVEALVPEVDLDAGELVLADRPGLLDPDDADVVEQGTS